MKIQDIIEKAGLKALTTLEERDVEGVYISDMLSDVMSTAKSGDLWLTVQTHKNIVSAANLVDAAAVVVTSGKTVPQDTVDIANRFHVNILSSPLPAFELARMLIGIGLTS